MRLDCHAGVDVGVLAWNLARYSCLSCLFRRFCLDHGYILLYLQRFLNRRRSHRRRGFAMQPGSRALGSFWLGRKRSDEAKKDQVIAYHRGMRRLRTGEYKGSFSSRHQDLKRPAVVSKNHARTSPIASKVKLFRFFRFSSLKAVLSVRDCTADW